MKHVAVAALAAVLIGCTGDPGPTGPAGRDGADGDTGPPGPPGLDGEGLVAVIGWDNFDGDPLALDDELIEITGQIDRLVTEDRFVYFYGYVVGLFPGDNPETEYDLHPLPAIVANSGGDLVLASLTLHGLYERVFFRFRGLRGFYVVASMLIFSRPTTEAEARAVMGRLGPPSSRYSFLRAGA